MPDTTLPPVGATVTDAEGFTYRYTANGWYVVGLDWARPIDTAIHAATLTATWRSEQARQEAEATVAEWRHAAAFASLPGTGSPNLSEPREWGRQQVALAVILCDDLSRYKALAKAATERLARFETLAREAREKLATPDWMSASFAMAEQLAQEAK